MNWSIKIFNTLGKAFFISLSIATPICVGFAGGGLLSIWFLYLNTEKWNTEQLQWFIPMAAIGIFAQIILGILHIGDKLESSGEKNE